MANKNNIIELNGKRYDANSGAFLGESNRLTKKVPKVVNDIVAVPTKSHRVQPTTVHAYTQTTPKKRSSAAAVAVKRKPQTAQTLMRTAVTKPSALTHSPVKAHGAPANNKLAVPTATSLRKLSSSSINDQRLSRAQQLQKSRSIRHFSPDIAAPLSLKSPAKPATQHLSDEPKIPTHVVSQHKNQPSLELFEKALASATSHQQTYRPKRTTHRKYIGLASAALSALLIAGFIAYVNVPNLTMSFAASRAGFHASLPGYRPAGFSVGRFSYSPGSVAVSFNSHSDRRSYSVIQKATQWDTQALYANYVAVTNQPYQTYHNAGRTVYLYGDNNATWVDGGVWYTVQGNDSLSSHQLLEMANSM